MCSVELLLKIGTLLLEMLGYEKTLDSFIDLLRRDEVRLQYRAARSYQGSYDF